LIFDISFKPFESIKNLTKSYAVYPHDEVVEISPAITQFIPHIALSGLEKLKIASILGVKFDLFFMFIDSELGTTPAHYQPMQCVGPHLRAGERSDRAADWHFEAYGRYPKRFAFLRCSGPGARRSGDCPA
jgi:hypothetical protein